MRVGFCLGVVELVGSWEVREAKGAGVDEEGDVKEEIGDEGEGENPASCETHKKRVEWGVTTVDDPVEQNIYMVYGRRGGGMIGSTDAAVATGHHLLQLSPQCPAIQR